MPRGILTPAMTRALHEMDDAEKREDYEDAEIVCNGVECWLGLRRISYGTVNALLRLTALSHDDSGGAQHYTLNDVSRCVLRRPELAKEIYVAILEGRPFTIENDRVKRL